VVRRVRITKAERQKRCFRHVIKSIYLSDLSGSIPDFMRFISELTDDVTEEYDEIILEENDDLYPSHTGIVVSHLIGYKIETDEQQAERIANLKEAKRQENKRRDAYEEKLYKSLRKKYGK
jgi:hypothetical protein